MKKFISSIVSFTLFFSFYFPLIVFGSTVIIFDTRQYDKGKGKPITYTDTFPREIHQRSILSMSGRDKTGKIWQRAEISL